MNELVIVGLVVLALWAISFTAYSMITSSIIKDQQRELAMLKAENRRLKAVARGKKVVSNLKLHSEQLDFPKAEVSYRKFLEI